MAISRRQYLKAALAGGCALCAGGGALLLRRRSGGVAESDAAAAEAAVPSGAGDEAPLPPVKKGPYEPLGEGLAREAGEWPGEEAKRIDGADRVLYSKRADWWRKLGKGRVQCTLCPRRCVVRPGGRGVCGVRANEAGEYRTLVWGNPCAVHIDPVEKKPLFHVRPGAKALSVATVGCNIVCKFCQNWNISQARPEDEEVRVYDLPAKKVASVAKERGCELIAYTYTEPVVFWEYMRDCAVAANDLGVGSVMISNGFIETAPLKRLLEVMTAVKIDLKAFTEKFYRDTCSGQLKAVLRTLETLAASGKWFEIVYLVVPTLNDSIRDVSAMSRWIAKELGPEVPIHFSVFHPCFRLKNLPRTPIATVRACADAASQAGLKYVYVGNARDKRESTYCPKCGATVIGRFGYAITDRNYKVTDGTARCAECGEKIPGIF